MEGHLGEMSIAEKLEFIEGAKTEMGGSEATRKKAPTKDNKGTNPTMKKENSLAQLDLPSPPGSVWSATGSGSETDEGFLQKMLAKKQKKKPGTVLRSSG